MIGCRIVLSGPAAIRVRCNRGKSTGRGWPGTFQLEGNDYAVVERLLNVDTMLGLSLSLFVRGRTQKCTRNVIESVYIGLF